MVACADEVGSRPRHHLVQFYEADEAMLVENVARYLAEGYADGSDLVVVATPEHARAFAAAMRDLGADPDDPERPLTVLDADDTLRRICIDRYPDAERFDRVVGAAVRASLARAGSGSSRIYGEMVGLLWSRGHYTAALRLEQLWDAMLRPGDFSLFCAYPIDIFGEHFDAGTIDALLCAHSHLLSGGQPGRLERSIMHAAADVLGVQAVAKLTNVTVSSRPAWGEMPRGESMILWLKKHLPDVAPAILARARERYLEGKHPQA